MSDRIAPGIISMRGPFWTIAGTGLVLFWMGCASAPPEPEVSQADITSVQERVEDVERTNGRLMVRVEEMERQVALVQDRVESNRIALQRHGHLRGGNDRFARAEGDRRKSQEQRPEPAPQSHYRQTRQDSDYRADPSMQQRMQRRGGTRIPLSGQQSGTEDHSQPTTDRPNEPDVDQFDNAPDRSGESASDQEALVITNEELEARYGPNRSATSTSSPPAESSESSSSGGSGSSAHPPVTSDRLPTSDELEDADREPPEVDSAPDTEPEARVEASDEELLDLYQDSLAQYRSGDYGEALQGFRTFLNSEPRDDYVDNALYWIGECHYGLGEYETSVDLFQRILDELPTANKVPDAMLKMSLAFDRLGQPQRAVEMLEELTEKYPNSNPGRLGAERLDEHPRSNRE